MDNEDKSGCITKIIHELNEYQNILNDTDHTISIIMRQIKETHNLSEDEYCDYEQTLKYILKD